MSDVIDDANERAEHFLRASLAKRRASWLKITGNCHYCSEACGTRLFCGPDCRDGYDEEQRIRAAQGADG